MITGTVSVRRSARSRPREAEAVEVRHHDVGQHQIGALRERPRERLGAVRNRDHLVALGE
jgi:hypothetical protein